MALSKKPSFNIADQLNQMNQISGNSTGEEEQEERTPLKDIPEPKPSVSYIPEPVERRVSKPKKKKKVDTSVMVGFRLPVEAKDQYIKYFEQYGMNLSVATKNALEYFIEDLQAGKVEITLTHHYKRVEQE